MNISEENKSFVWFQAKTGTNLSVEILKNFGFVTRFNTPNGLKTVPLKGVHSTLYPTNHEDYIFICTARNPFTRILSTYKFNHKNHQLWSPEGFQDYFNHIYTKTILKSSLWPFKERLPDYFLRIENLYDDYSKVPFVKESGDEKLKLVKDLCEIKFNSTQEIQNPNEYFTQEIKDLIFSLGEKYFKLLNYDYPF